MIQIGVLLTFVDIVCSVNNINCLGKGKENSTPFFISNMQAASPSILSGFITYDHNKVESLICTI